MPTTRMSATRTRSRSKSRTSATSTTYRSSRSWSRPATPSRPTTRCSRSSPTRRRWTCRRRSPATVERATASKSATRSRRARAADAGAGERRRRRSPRHRPRRRSGAPTEAEARRRGRAAPSRPRSSRARAAAARRARRAGRRADARAADGQRRRSRLRQPVGPAARPRARRRPAPGERQRPQGPDHQGGRAGVRRRGPRLRRPALRLRRAGGPVLGLDLPPWPQVDFEKFGAVERVQRSRIQRISGPVPGPQLGDDPARHAQRRGRHHRARGVAQAARTTSTRATGVKVTMVSFLVVASVATLKAFPDVQLLARRRGPDPEALLQHRLRRRHARRPRRAGDQERRPEGAAGDRARADRAVGQGARRQARCPATCRARSFTISSLGGIGGTSFTPIINAPEVAILGATRSAMKPVWNGSEFVPRLMVPLSLSYDHRVIDGAAAARFIVTWSSVLSDLRRALL